MIIYICIVWKSILIKKYPHPLLAWGAVHKGHMDKLDCKDMLSIVEDNVEIK